MVDPLNQMVISKCGSYAFKKESLAVEEEMKSFFSVHSSCQRNCFIVRGRGEDNSNKCLGTESEVNT